MSNLSQGVPQFGTPFTDGKGGITQVWYQFLLNIFNRTGGSSGSQFAPSDGTYVVASSEVGLPNANIATNTATISWDFSSTGHAKVNVNQASLSISESQVINLTTDLAARVVTSTQVIAGAGLTGGGALSTNVTLSLAQMATLTIKGNNTGGTTSPIDLTVAQVNAILPVFTSTLNGLVPLSGGGTINYLRADATFSNPLSGGISGSVTLAKLTGGGSNGSITYTNGLITAVSAPT